ncbi:MAG: DUF3987 domain-containing protein, partial [Oscillospiraceae bacterium]
FFTTFIISHLSTFLVYIQCTGNSGNCLYPNKMVVTDKDTFITATKMDHVTAKYKGNYRSKDNFESSDCIPLDCDNDHSDNPNDWVTPFDIAIEIPGVAFAASFSRHHNVPKGDKSARPRFHVFFPVPEVTDEKEYTAMKKRIADAFPYFDTNALDSARFLYGTNSDEVEFYEGDRTILDFLEDDFDAEMTRKIPQGSRNNTMSRFAGRVVKRYGVTPQARQIFDDEAEKCDPPLDDYELESIWKSACKFGKKIEKQEGYVQPEEYNKPPNWEMPVPFDDYDLPPFPVEALPVHIGEFVLSLSESVQAPADLAANACLSVMSVAAQGKYKIQAKPDWIEPVNLECLSIMKSSERKSAVANQVIKPLNIYETEMNRRNAAAVETSKMQKRILEKRQKAIEEQASKGKADSEEVSRIAEEIAEYKEVKPIKLYVDDITTEKLTSVLADNNGCAAILSTEGGIFDTLAGSYSKNVNIDVMLKGYSGDCIRVDRIGRTSESIMNPALTVHLMVQPNVLSGLMQNSTFTGRGLTARFLYSMPKSFVGKRKYRSEPLSQSAYDNYESCIINMLEDESEGGPEIITLSREADTMIEAFANELEPKLVGEYADIADWAGKLVGNVLRISALLTRASVFRTHRVFENPEPLSVDKMTMENSIKIGRYYIEHAKAAFALMGVDPVVNLSKKVINTVKENGLAEFKKRDIMRMCRSIKNADEAQKAIDRLQDYGYIAEKQTEVYAGKGRPPAQIYLVNPYIWRNKND